MRLKQPKPVTMEDLKNYVKLIKRRFATSSFFRLIKLTPQHRQRHT